MGILTSIFSFFGCGQNSNKKRMTMQTVYATDHKLTMQERKEFTNSFLRQKGIPILEHLPFVEDYAEARFRDQRQVACKSVVIYGLIYVAHNERTAEEMISYFKKYNLWNYVSPNEKKYLEKPIRTEQENNSISWRIECLNVLLWSLGHFDTLSFPTDICDFSNYKNLPNLDNDPTEWINNSKLRNTEDILNETDMIYRIHWAVRDASLNGKPIPAKINEDIVMERHFALNWLVIYAENWGDITTDT
ncbi:DUF4272 domain-containing protein [Porphyromonas pogonae]|uniref:DUF4272 domain-containing protein n=1 Tax=Porphyromonas pogonae TaxID=867595 RepID=UPI002E79B541|nr:DUF4272 domain-containing protein [Porphyromonas pogonae]